METKRKRTRRLYTAREKLGYIEKIKALIASGDDIQQACKKVDLHTSQFYMWKKHAVSIRREAERDAPSKLPTQLSEGALNGKQHGTNHSPQIGEGTLAYACGYIECWSDLYSRSAGVSPTSLAFRVGQFLQRKSRG